MRPYIHTPRRAALHQDTHCRRWPREGHLMLLGLRYFPHGFAASFNAKYDRDFFTSRRRDIYSLAAFMIKALRLLRALNTIF